MKKVISVFLVIISVMYIFPFHSLAAKQSNISDWYSKEIVVETAKGIYDSENERGLIITKKLSLFKTSTQLLISATTTGSTEVTKCGFTYIKLQRLISGTWTDYTTCCYYDQYSNSTTKTFSRYVSVPKGYTYRVICEHYAEKPMLLFFTTSETSYNETNSLYF
ncbi:MAG: hypothetical protein MJ168_08410 [Clostridia bacterium]|nr:hypothetical protein [Clostridia bacterium]